MCVNGVPLDLRGNDRLPSKVNAVGLVRSLRSVIIAAVNKHITKVNCVQCLAYYGELYSKPVQRARIIVNKRPHYRLNT